MTTGKCDRIEVYEATDDRPRHKLTKGSLLGELPIDAPAPVVGDIIWLPRVETGPSEAGPFLVAECTPFRVVGREHLYSRTLDYVPDRDPAKRPPPDYLNTWLLVRRVTEAEYTRPIRDE